MPPKPKTPGDKKASDIIHEGSNRMTSHQPDLTEAREEKSTLADPDTGEAAPVASISASAGTESRPLTEVEVILEMSAQQRRLLRADELFQEFCRTNQWAPPPVDPETMARIEATHQRHYEEILRLQSEAQQALERAGNTETVRLNPNAKEFIPEQQGESRSAR